jgi:hypothetical protein
VRLLIALVSSLALTVVAVPADARATATAPDPVAVATLQAAARASYLTVWRKVGGTYEQHCTDAVGDGYRSVVELDAKTHTQRRRTDGSGALGTTVFKGRFRYLKVSGAVRRSLRIHGAPMKAAWTRERAVWDDDLWGGEDGPILADVNAPWAELATTPLAGGGTSFVGKMSLSAGSNAEWRNEIAAQTDAQGRLTRVESVNATASSGGVVLRSSDCVETWAWSRPHLSAPRRSQPYRMARLFWEVSAITKAAGVVTEADKMLAAGTAEADVITWLQAQVGSGQRLPAGIRLVVRSPRKSTARPPVAFRITVRDGRASYRPVR